MGTNGVKRLKIVTVCGYSLNLSEFQPLCCQVTYTGVPHERALTKWNENL